MKKDLTLSWQHMGIIFKIWKCPQLIVLHFIVIKQGCLEVLILNFHPTHEGWEKHPQFPKRKRFLWLINLLLLCLTDFRHTGHPWLLLNPASVILRGLFPEKKNSYTEGRLSSLTTPIWGESGQNTGVLFSLVSWPVCEGCGDCSVCSPYPGGVAGNMQQSCY